MISFWYENPYETIPKSRFCVSTWNVGPTTSPRNCSSSVSPLPAMDHLNVSSTVPRKLLANVTSMGCTCPTASTPESGSNLNFDPNRVSE